jgi:hypothetical protein
VTLKCRRPETPGTVNNHPIPPRPTFRIANLRFLVEAFVPRVYEHVEMSIQSQSDQSLSVQRGSNQSLSVHSRPGVRQRTRTFSDFCFACNTPWTLTAEQRNGMWVVFCTRCGIVRPPRRDLVAPSPW